ncbi:MAG: cytochrome b N-terminal domain-containing protein [Armatimonadota bacterium]|nr:cytochrome b N-terminal domain-containing protein [Armatimonadota bacterium]MDR7402417.1 cytochrome b N-terminal domain-containing protein [Armatimonadota bacterium]MDR7404243.1 cytochrome b N-terminal domain-containing protein [Armatimonadota bacterium]MDR7437562.1 cytochrome b N-terminal domain-containing protein [Armatimonadota bacterium]MDR7472156.1 cytochrome b N-terminal domain-containing protein [Armatimonadota bacterium]
MSVADVRPSRYGRVMTALLRATLRVDTWIHRIVPTDYNPLYYTGGLANLFLLVLVLSGIFLFFYYEASLEGAFASVRYLTQAVPYGGLLRGVHRYAADAFVVAILLHLFRNWFTDRYLFSRDNPWISGMILLLFGGFIGVTGYQLVWDERAQVLTALFARLLRSIPGVGGALAELFLGGRGVSDATLVRMLFLHIGPASALYLLLWWHYLRLRHPKIWPPAMWVLFCVGLVFLLAGLIPVGAEAIPPAAPAARPTRFALDVFFLWPFWLLNWLPPRGVVALGVVLFTAGLAIPYLSRREHPAAMGVRHAGVAQVIDGNCTGCELCYYDCPYNAIVMVPSPAPGLTKAAANRTLLAVVVESRCVECGICIGACPFEALELPRLLERDVLAQVAEAVSA